MSWAVRRALFVSVLVLVAASHVARCANVDGTGIARQ